MGVTEKVAVAGKTFRECSLPVGVYGHFVAYCRYRTVAELVRFLQSPYVMGVA
jgi:hypothetical protein